MAALPGTAAEALEMYQVYVAAEKAVLASKSYTIGGKSLTRADLPGIIEGRKEWLATYRQLSRGGRAIRGITPC